MAKALTPIPREWTGAVIEVSGEPCRQPNRDAEDWFPEVAPQTNAQKVAAAAYAREQCRGCTMPLDCLLSALLHAITTGDVPTGIWGGTAEWERTEILRTLAGTESDTAAATREQDGAAA